MKKDAWTPVFIAALFTTAMLWKQSRCATTDEWMKKMCHPHTHSCALQYYSTIKKIKIMLFSGKWMELVNIMLSKVSQVQKDKGCMFSFLCVR
jgi:hypothetical protein